MPAPLLERVHAPGLRLGWFVDALVAAGRRVHIGEMQFGGEAARTFLPRRDVESHRVLGPTVAEAAAQVEHWIREIEPEAVIALTDIGAISVVNSGYEGPLYVDYFGDPMAERQQQAFVHGSNASLADAWLYLLPVLLRADRFSVGSNAQRLALTGELAAAGRINSETCGKDLVDVVRPGLPFRTPHKITDGRILQKYSIPSEGRRIFLSGGYNTWLDEATLFAGIEGALKADPTLRFISAGGAIPGHVTKVYENFEERIFTSTERHRFHMLGWLPHKDLLDVMANCHVAVNADFPVLEGEVGFRNRLLEWLWAGMRVVSTATSSPAFELAEMGLMRQVPCGNPEALAAAILEEAARGRHEDSDELLKALLWRWNASENLKAVVEWTADPTRAPDRQADLEDNPLVALQRRFLAAASRENEEKSVRREARTLAQHLLGSKLIRIWGFFHPEAMEKIREAAKL